MTNKPLTINEIEKEFDEEFRVLWEAREGVKAFYRQKIEELVKVIFEDLKLWRPIFYLDKVTKEDLEELEKLKKALKEKEK